MKYKILIVFLCVVLLSGCSTFKKIPKDLPKIA